MFHETPGNLKKKLKTKTQQLLKDSSLFPVTAFEELVNTPKRQELLAAISCLVSLSTYEEFYLKTLINFAEFTQQLPATAHSYYAYPGGMLDHALFRSYIALSLCRSYFLLDQMETAEVLPEHERWLFTLFTAALLLDLGKMSAKQEVTLFDNQRNPLGIWQTSTGSMLTQAYYYEGHFVKENKDQLSKMYNPILARQLLEKTGCQKMTGFDWIASNSETLETWLAILSGMQTDGNYLLTIVPLAEAHSIAAYFTEINKALLLENKDIYTNNKYIQLAILPDIPPRNAETPHRHLATGNLFQPGEVVGTSGYTVATATTSIVTGSVANTIAPSLAAGEAFMNWLKRNIQRQDWISDPNAPIQRVKEGLFLSHPKLIQQFCRENPKYGNWQTIYEQFNQLELASDGGKAQTYYNRNSSYRKLQEGILVNPFLFLTEKQLSQIEINHNFMKINSQALELQIARQVGLQASANNSLSSKN